MQETFETSVLGANESGIAKAAELLRRGQLVAIPTETVYGLGADACNSMAVAAIYEAKERPSFNPLIVHASSVEEALTIVDLPDMLRNLAMAFWPGPLTLVAPKRQNAGIAEIVTAGQPSIAVRVPDNQIALALIKELGRPIAAPSANPSGRISPTRVEHVLDGLGGRISAVLDGGPCEVGLESTIVGMVSDAPVLFRPGGISREAISSAIGEDIRLANGDQIVTPGQLASHYAPVAQVRLNAAGPQDGEIFLGFGKVAGPDGWNLSPAGDLREAAANLFSLLRDIDAFASSQEISRIAIAPVPATGIGLAINDRLMRAAAPRQ